MGTCVTACRLQVRQLVLDLRVDERPKTRETPRVRGRRTSEPHKAKCGCIELRTELHAGVSHFALHELLFDEPSLATRAHSAPSAAPASQLAHSFSVQVTCMLLLLLLLLLHSEHNSHSHLAQAHSNPQCVASAAAPFVTFEK